MSFPSMFIVSKRWQYGKYSVAILLSLFYWVNVKAQTAEEIIQKIKMKLEKINDYEAEGKMKTNVAFIKAPIATVKVFYKKPDKLLILNESGISFIPRGSVNINISNLFVNMRSFDIIDAGKDNAGLRVIIDGRNESLGKRIREGTVKKTPYLLVVGDKEVQSRSVAVRSYKEGDKGVLQLGEFVKQAEEKIKQKN